MPASEKRVNMMNKKIFILILCLTLVGLLLAACINEEAPVQPTDGESQGTGEQVTDPVTDPVSDDPTEEETADTDRWGEIDWADPDDDTEPDDQETTPIPDVTEEVATGGEIQGEDDWDEED